jgi:hypothetical protein
MGSLPSCQCDMDAVSWKHTERDQKEGHAARFEPRWLRMGYRNDSLHVYVKLKVTGDPGPRMN